MPLHGLFRPDPGIITVVGGAGAGVLFLIRFFVALLGDSGRKRKPYVIHVAAPSSLKECAAPDSQRLYGGSQRLRLATPQPDVLGAASEGRAGYHAPFPPIRLVQSHHERFR